MTDSPPISALERLIQKLKLPQLPSPLLLPLQARAIHGAQQRLVLLFNHVLMQDRLATERLTGQQGRVILLRWRTFQLCTVVTPAGLFDLVGADDRPDLTISVTDTSPLALVRSALKQETPALHIEGNVQLASDVHWVIGHVRWDIQSDLALIIGDVPAHTLCRWAKGLAAALQQFIALATERMACQDCKDSK